MIGCSDSPYLAKQFIAEMNERGFAIVTGVLHSQAVDAFLSALAQLERPTRDRRCGETYAIRNLMEVVPAVRELAVSERVRGLVEPVLGSSAFPVQALFFDKPVEANWKVPWHQDLSVPVKARVDLTGFGPWSVKDGVPHVQPPVSLLERMLIVRLHLDECTEDNGPLRVIAGSQQHGRLSPSDIERLRAEGEEVTCLVPRGGALVMRPLLLHASSAARVPGHRRVIHLEYAADALPGGLAWHGSDLATDERRWTRRDADSVRRPD